MAYDLTARLRLVDNMTSPLRRVTDSFRRTDDAVNRVTRATNAYRDANGRLRDENGRFISENKKVAQSFDLLGGSLNRVKGFLGGLAVGAATVGFAYSSLKKAMDFEEQMSTIKALTGASNEEMKRMNDLAIKMGGDTKYSALEAAQGIEELLKAGLSPAAVEAGGLEAALNLATAGGLGLADAAEIMSTALNAYKRDAMTAAEASDILAGTANASATSVMELRYSLAMVSAVASGVGQSFRDTNTALGLFANNGLKGSDAGTSLKVMMMNLSPKTKKATELMQKLGIITKKGQNQFYTATGELRSLAEISDVLRKSLEKLNPKARMDALAEIFGTDGVRGATILFNEGAEGVRKFQAEMSKVTALDVAKEKMNNAKGAIEQLSGAIETIQISALQPLLPVIKDLTLMFADMAEQYGPQIAATFEDIGRSIREFLDPYLNDPKTWKVEGQAEFKFRQMEMLDQPNGPPPFWENLLGRFNEWYDTSGKQLIEDGASSVAKDFAKFLEDNSAPIAKAGLSIGTKIAASTLEGMRQGLNSTGFGQAAINSVVPGFNLGSDLRNWAADTFFGPKQSHYHGIEYVPRDGYSARLHKGERVLTAQENKDYSSGSGRGGVTISGNTFVVNAAGGDLNDEKVIDRLMDGFVRKLVEVTIP
ncbi:phage tail tape measure protein, TP901 family [Brevibacillus borstelensis AK1]|uniref:Phage tail tape measure protein, TP901 family n=1 Tax=Brevibacillus borstelensis AK1 TaxID=1300222 RepID=M8E632_9BACL|nr:phage tail tape measure protein [Brevibacillus borstelensis]EMT54711.1 phage tail tape measure protein, TP901 family [Brevibacillus borstelensis AK1]